MSLRARSSVGELSKTTILFLQCHYMFILLLDVTLKVKKLILLLFIIIIVVRNVTIHREAVKSRYKYVTIHINEIGQFIHH